MEDRPTYGAESISAEERLKALWLTISASAVLALPFLPIPCIASHISLQNIHLERPSLWEMPEGDVVIWKE